jgi:hypothetical protein
MFDYSKVDSKTLVLFRHFLYYHFPFLEDCLLYDCFPSSCVDKLYDHFLHIVNSDFDDYLYFL